MQIYRLFEIVYILLHEKLVTAKSLAERFEVSQRTIYRDIDILSMSGIPVYTEKGKGGGISLLPDFMLNKSLLSEQEQMEILSALQGLSNVKTPDTDHVLSKLSAIFQKNAANWLEVDFTFWNDDNSELFNSFKTAILERRIAEFDYYSTYGKK
jgi:predicted DNA-binding transcriptional regulator YafY